MEKAARTGARSSSLHALDDYEVYGVDAHRDVAMTPSSRPSAISSGAYDDQRTVSSMYCGDHISANENLSIEGSDLHVDCSETETVAGILYKWVNLGKGWRPRWFVLKDGVLKYYKIHGPNKITVCDPMYSVSRIIGEESQKLAKKQKNTHRPCKAFGEVHLQVSTIRKSNSDDKKFYIFTGTKTLHLRVESRKDRNTWLEALRIAKMNFQVFYPKPGAVPLSLQMEMSTERLRSRLMQEGLSDTVIGDCEAVVQTEFSSLFRRLRVLEESHINLLERLKQLEGEKMELETTVIDESQDKAHSDEFGEDGGESEMDTEDERELNNGVEGESDEDENAFFDTHEYLSSDSLCHSTCTYNEGSKKSLEGNAEINADVGDVSIENIRFDYPFVERRRRLPEPKEREKGVGLWSMIKDNIGKDLSKICLPVYFNEPLSSLQKCFEDLEYSSLLDRAAVLGKRGDHLQQILHIAAFAVSGYSSTEGRICKPFNPLLGETYEACYPDKGLRFISEKVSHHPMTLACHCEGNGWVFWGESTLKSKFWGRSIQLDPVGVLMLQFADGQRFHWSKVTTSIHNLIIGKLYCDHYGTMRIQGGGDLVCKIKFKEQSIMERSPHQVQGYVYNKEGIKLASLFGKWDEAIYYILGDISTRPKNFDPMTEAVLLWRINDRPEFPTRYNLTSFAITLNEMTPDLKERLPPTDSRLRPDQRHLENGEYELANREKLRLEEKQRQARKLQEKGWQPQWFRKNNETQAFEYVGGYWDARESRNWESCPDIFGKETTVEPPL